MPAHVTPETNQPALFEDATIRRVLHNGLWHWSVTDILAALTESNNVRRYWSELKKKLKAEGAVQLLDKIEQLKMLSSDGKRYKTDAADLETLLRIIQAVPSPRAEPLKRWLAKTAVERLQEEADPDLAIDRAIRRYRQFGLSREQVKARIDGVMKRNELTAEWKGRGISDDRQYGILTGMGYQKVFRMNAKAICERLGVKKNPRNAMPEMALQAMTFHEALARNLTIQMNAQGFQQCQQAVQAAGDITRRTVEDMERVMGQPILPVVRQDQGDLMA